MNVTEIINSFRIFLNVSWAGLPGWLKDIKESDEAIYDWFQANWETIVETKINQVRFAESLSNNLVTIEHFGYGADCYGTSSRVFRPDALPTHYIKVNGLYRFDSFGNKFDTGWFDLCFPFDFVKVTDENDNEIILNADNLVYSLTEINM